MTDNIHISPAHFMEVVEKRISEYREALFGNRGSFAIEQTMMTARLHNMQTLKQLIDQNALIKSALWGYGINQISDGQEEHSVVDVEVIKRTTGLNKHNQPFRNFLLLMFKIEKGAFWVSTFSIDSCAPNINSNINTCYSLTQFQHARMRTRGQAIFCRYIFFECTEGCIVPDRHLSSCAQLLLPSSPG